MICLIIIEGFYFKGVIFGVRQLVMCVLIEAFIVCERMGFSHFSFEQELFMAFKKLVIYQNFFQLRFSKKLLVSADRLKPIRLLLFAWIVNPVAIQSMFFFLQLLRS